MVNESGAASGKRGQSVRAGPLARGGSRARKDPASAVGDATGRGSPHRPPGTFGGKRSGGGRQPAPDDRRSRAPEDGRQGGKAALRPNRQGAQAERRGGPRLAATAGRRPEPAILEGVSGAELDRSVRAELRTLSKENAEGVAKHLVMVAALLEEDPTAARAHAETAVRRAGRVPAAREALGLVAYRQGDFARALTEFRTARRLSGSSHLLALIVDCERALGRPGRALEIAASPEARHLGTSDRVELAIVVSGIRRDAGQLEAAAAELEMPQLRSPARRPWAARLRYAYAEAQLALGNRDAARRWFAQAVEADLDLATDAAERLEELDGVAYVDLLEAARPEDPAHGSAEGAG